MPFLRTELCDPSVFPAGASLGSVLNDLIIGHGQGSCRPTGRETERFRPGLERYIGIVASTRASACTMYPVTITRVTRNLQSRRADPSYRYRANCGRPSVGSSKTLPLFDGALCDPRHSTRCGQAFVPMLLRTSQQSGHAEDVVLTPRVWPFARSALSLRAYAVRTILRRLDLQPGC